MPQQLMDLQTGVAQIARLVKAADPKRQLNGYVNSQWQTLLPSWDRVHKRLEKIFDTPTMAVILESKHIPQMKAAEAKLVWTEWVDDVLMPSLGGAVASATTGVERQDLPLRIQKAADDPVVGASRAWLARRAEFLREYFGETTGRSLQAVLDAAIQRGQWTAGGLAAEMKGVLRATPNQAQSILRRFLMESRKPDEGGVGLRQARSNLRTRLLSAEKARAEAVLQYELSQAWNHGALESVIERVEEGELDADTVKVVVTAQDERVCRICGPQNGKAYALKDPIPLSNGEEVLAPPFHFRCRCALAYKRHNEVLEQEGSFIGRMMRGWFLLEMGTGAARTIAGLRHHTPAMTWDGLYEIMGGGDPALARAIVFREARERVEEVIDDIGSAWRTDSARLMEYEEYNRISNQVREVWHANYANAVKKYGQDSPEAAAFIEREKAGELAHLIAAAVRHKGYDAAVVEEGKLALFNLDKLEEFIIRDPSDVHEKVHRVHLKGHRVPRPVLSPDDAEIELRDLEVEHIYGFDADGNLVDQATQLRRNTAGWVRTEMPDLDDGIMVHNHPERGGGFPPSLADLEVAIHMGLRESRIVTPQWVYTLERTGDRWLGDDPLRSTMGAVGRLRMAWEAYQIKFSRTLLTRQLRGELSAKQAAEMRQWETWQRLAEGFGFKATRRPHPGMRPPDYKWELTAEAVRNQFKHNLIAYEDVVDEMVDLPFQTWVVYDRDKRMIGSSVGKRYSVKWKDELWKLYDNVWVRNHPNSPAGFTWDYVGQAIRYNAHQIEVVGNPWHYRLVRPNVGKWGITEEALHKRYVEVKHEVGARLAEAVTDKRLTPSQAVELLYHEVWKELAYENGWYYERIPIPGAAPAIRLDIPRHKLLGSGSTIAFDDPFSGWRLDRQVYIPEGQYSTFIDFKDADGNEVGQMILRPYAKDQLIVDDIVVDEQYWRQGFGTEMYDQAAEWGARNGLTLYTVRESLTPEGRKLFQHRLRTGRLGEPIVETVEEPPLRAGQPPEIITKTLYPIRRPPPGSEFRMPRNDALFPLRTVVDQVPGRNMYLAEFYTTRRPTRFEADNVRVANATLVEVVPGKFIIAGITSRKSGQGVATEAYDELARWAKARGAKIYTHERGLTDDGVGLYKWRVATGRLGPVEEMVVPKRGPGDFDQTLRVQEILDPPVTKRRWISSWDQIDEPVSLHHAEELIRDAENELAFAFTRDGELPVRIIGGSQGVLFSPVEAALMRGTVFTHNHPSGTPGFSDADVLAAAKLELSELRAVTSTATHALRPVAGQWLRPDEDLGSLRQRFKSAWDQNSAEMTRLGYTKEANGEFWYDEMWKKTAADMGWQYERTARGKEIPYRNVMRTGGFKPRDGDPKFRFDDPDAPPIIDYDESKDLSDKIVLHAEAWDTGPERNRFELQDYHGYQLRADLGFSQEFRVRMVEEHTHDILRRLQADPDDVLAAEMLHWAKEFHKWEDDRKVLNLLGDTDHDVLAAWLDSITDSWQQDPHWRHGPGLMRAVQAVFSTQARGARLYPAAPGSGFDLTTQISGFYASNPQAMRVVARYLHEATRKHLIDDDIEYVTLYRGMMHHVSDFEDGVVDERFVDLKLNPISSFTTEYQTARSFVGESRVGDQLPAVYAVRVHRDDILAMPSSGMGHLGATEVLVLGGRYRAVQLNPGVVRTEGQLVKALEKVGARKAPAAFHDPGVDLPDDPPSFEWMPSRAQAEAAARQIDTEDSDKGVVGEWFIKFKEWGAIWNEEAAYRVAHALGVGSRVVPQKAFPRVNGEFDASFSPYLPGRELREHVDEIKDRLINARGDGNEDIYGEVWRQASERGMISAEEVQRMQVFEFITGAADRHFSNYIIADGKGLLGLDYEFAFNHFTPLHWDSGRTLHHILEAVSGSRTIPAGVVEDALQNYGKVLTALRNSPERDGLESVIDGVMWRYTRLAVLLERYPAGEAIDLKDFPVLTTRLGWDTNTPRERMQRTGVPDEHADLSREQYIELVLKKAGDEGGGFMDPGADPAEAAKVIEKLLGDDLDPDPDGWLDRLASFSASARAGFEAEEKIADRMMELLSPKELEAFIREGAGGTTPREKLRNTIRIIKSQWESGTFFPDAIAYQKGVEAEFKDLMPGTVAPINQEIFGDLGTRMYEAFPKGWRALARAHYEETQQWFRDQGITEVPLFRGLRSEEPFVEKGLRWFPARPVSSYSVSLEMALDFAHNERAAAMGQRYGALIAETVPVERILSTPRSGFGVLGQGEILVLGGEHRVLLLTGDRSGEENLGIKRAIRELREWGRPERESGPPPLWLKRPAGDEKPPREPRPPLPALVVEDPDGVSHEVPIEDRYDLMGPGWKRHEDEAAASVVKAYEEAMGVSTRSDRDLTWKWWVSDDELEGAKGSFDPVFKRVLLSEEASEGLERLLLEGEVTPYTIDALHTLLHELGHASSPILRLPVEDVYSDFFHPASAFFEEGLVEWRSRRALSRILLSDPPDSPRLQHFWAKYGSYKRETSAMEFLAELYGTDAVDKIYHQGSTLGRIAVANKLVEPWIKGLLLRRGFTTSDVDTWVEQLLERESLWELLRYRKILDTAGNARVEDLIKGLAEII